jgi:uncharacterized membrane protein YkvA (DUF1232 family)
MAFRDRGRPGSHPIGERVGAVIPMLWTTAVGTYAGMTRARLSILLLACAYVVSPFDAIPEGLFGFFGLPDDSFLSLWLAGALVADTNTYLTWRKAGELPTLDGGDDGPRPRVVDGEVVDRRLPPASGGSA